MNTTERLARRQLLRRGLIWGGVGAAAASGVTVVAAPAEARERRTYSLDVACLGETFRVIWAPGAPQSGDLRGSTFSVEGAIYPPGTIDGSGFDPAAHADERIGTWFCRGWILISGDRPEPHALTTQEYVLGPPGSDPFAADQLVSSGTEGSDRGATAVRSVTGGAGRFRGASGEVLQHGNGTNTTSLVGLGLPAPNFIFEFRLARNLV